MEIELLVREAFAEHGLDVDGAWLEDRLQAMGAQLLVLKAAVAEGELSQEQLQGLLAFKVDAMLAAAFAEVGVMELEQARLRERVVTVLKKPLRGYFGFDVLV